MAWIQNLSGQAEKLLNKIDQKAADVLNDTNFARKTSPKKLLKEIDSADDVATEFEEVTERKLQSEAENDQIRLNIPEEPIDENPIDNSPARSLPKEDVQSIIILDDKKTSVSSKSESMTNSFSMDEDIQRYIEKISKLEFENEGLSRQLLNIQHLYSVIRNENDLLRNNCERANEMISAAENEMEQYKIRALKLLQEKEKLISLKRETSEEQNCSEDNVNINFFNELKNELKFQQDKNEELSSRISNLVAEISSLQQQYAVMQNSLQQKNQKLENELFNEKRMRISLEDDVKLKSQDLTQLRQELISMGNELRIKNQDIEKLKSKVHESSSLTNNEELEYRIRTLTQTLMLKQNNLETVTSERNALKIQLEKLENEYQRHLVTLRSSQQRIVHVNDTDDVKLQIPPMMRISPLDASVTRRVKHAYSSLDSLSIRTGVFLRRYPGIRVLLHLWVIVILLNYAPK